MAALNLPSVVSIWSTSNKCVDGDASTAQEIAKLPRELWGTAGGSDGVMSTRGGALYLVTGERKNPAY